MRRRLFGLLTAALLFGACSRPAPPPPQTTAPPAEVLAPSPSEPAPPAQPYRFTAHVSNSPDGPWTEYRQGITLSETPLWLRLTADRPLPADAVTRLKGYLVTPEGAEIRLLNDTTFLVGVADQPVLWTNAQHLNDEVTATDPFVVFGGSPARVVEIVPESGQATQLITLEPPPGDMPVYVHQNGTLFYKSLSGFTRSDLKAGKATPVASLPAQPAPAGPAKIYGTHGAGRWVESPSPDGTMVARLDVATTDPGRPISLVIQERSTGKVLIQSDQWVHLTSIHPCFSPGIDPAWSPDSRQLAALSLVGQDQVELAVVDVAAGTTRRVARQPAGEAAYQAQVSWSPDGSFLLFRHSLVDAATGQVRSTSVLYQNQWRADGRYRRHGRLDPGRHRPGRGMAQRQAHPHWAQRVLLIRKQAAPLWGCLPLTGRGARSADSPSCRCRPPHRASRCQPGAWRTGFPGSGSGR